MDHHPCDGLIRKVVKLLFLLVHNVVNQLVRCAIILHHLCKLVTLEPQVPANQVDRAILIFVQVNDVDLLSGELPFIKVGPYFLDTADL